jgi:hypothetical protein
MRGDCCVDNFAPEGAQARQGPLLVEPDQPAIAGNVGREYGSEPALDPRFAQGALLGTPRQPAKPFAWVIEPSVLRQLRSINRLSVRPSDSRHCNE